MLQAPASSTQDHQPHGAPRGRRHRTPSPSPTKLRPTRRAWLLLWLTAALIAVADGGLLLRGASVTVMVEGRSRSLPAGLTIAQVLERLELPAMAGDLLAVDHNVLRKGAYPPRVLVNGQPARATQRLHRGDRITVARGQSRIEPVTRAIQQHAGSRPGNPMRSLPTGPARAVLDRGKLSGRVEAMSSTRRDPETRLMGEGERSTDHAWQALRRHGGRRLLRDAFLRFRSGDGFSDARALGLQLRLAAVPLLIAAISSARAWC